MYVSTKFIGQPSHGLVANISLEQQDPHWGQRNTDDDQSAEDAYQYDLKNRHSANISLGQ